MRPPSLRAPARASLAVLLLAACLGCHRHGEPIEPSASVSGRWEVPTSLDLGVTLEMLDDGSGALTGSVLVDDGDSLLAAYAIQGGAVEGGEFAFTIDPLDPPIFEVLEVLGRSDPIRFAGRLDTRETILLEIEQECADSIACFGAATEVALASPFYTSNAVMNRPFGVAGSFADLALEQSGDVVTGFLSIIFGTSQGGTAIPALPVHNGAVTDSNLFFMVDPSDDPTGALAESLGCSSPLVYIGVPDAGSTIRFRVFQGMVAGEDTTICVNGFTTWNAAEVFQAFQDTTPIIVGADSTEYDMEISTTQDGSIIRGTVTFENDQVREGPFTIEDGRLFGGVLTFEIRPSEFGSVAFVTALGSAAPIAFELRIAGGLSVEVTARQGCPSPCLSESLVASKIPVGL
jgi:hypothetical protein